MSVVCSESWPGPDYHHLITRLSEWCPGLPSLGHPHWLISGGRINLGLASSNSGKYAMMWDWWNIRWGMSRIVRTLTPESRWDWQRSHTIWCHNYKHGTSNYYDESFVTKVTKKLENSKQLKSNEIPVTTFISVLGLWLFYLLWILGYNKIAEKLQMLLKNQCECSPSSSNSNIRSCS